MKNNGMDPETIHLETLLDTFLEEMEKGLHGKAMLPMSPTYVPGDMRLGPRQNALAVDVGGTNLRFALTGIDELGAATISEIKQAELPGLREPVDSGMFFDTIADHILPYLKYTDMVSFSFAHEAVHMPDMDAKALPLSKELIVTGIEGQLIGESLKKALAKRGATGVKTVVINDSVGAACSMALQKESYDSFAGLIEGTGTNTCYIEQSKNITKITGFSTGSMFVNVESCEFLPPRGVFDLEFDRMTDAPGMSPLEKMISGRYIGGLFWLTVRRAAEHGLLSEHFRNAFGKLDMTGTIELSDFLANPEGPGLYAKMCNTASDRNTLYTIARMLISRGARLIALEVAGIAVKTGKGLNVAKPICVVAEGTTYYTLKGLREEVENLVYGWLKQSKGVHVKLCKVENAALKGIGIVGLCS